MNASTYSWEVQIQGDQFDLEHLARHFESSDVGVSKLKGPTLRIVRRRIEGATHWLANQASHPIVLVQCINGASLIGAVTAPTGSLNNPFA